MSEEEKVKKEKADKDDKDDKDRAYAVIRLVGIKVSGLEEELKDILSGENPKAELTEKDGEARIKLHAVEEGDISAKKVLKPVVKEIKSRLGQLIFATDDSDSLEDSVVSLLRENGFTISAAESCTAGLFTGRLANVPGTSEILKAGFITYSEKAKRKFALVKRHTLSKYGAVSKETAEEMSRGVCAVAGSDCGVSITGIAGPDGGTEKKPVGLVYIGVTIQKKTTVKEFIFSGDRQDIRQRAVTEALALLRTCLLKRFSEVTFK